MNKEQIEQKWDKIIKPKTNLLDLKLKQVWECRDLIYLFVKRDFLLFYKQTILGPLWYVLQPIFSTITFMLVFGTLAKLSTDGVPQILFYYLGTMLWSFFSGCLNSAAHIFIDNVNIFGKVYFPRLTAPIAGALTILIKLCIQCILFCVLYFFFYFRLHSFVFSWHVLFLPLLVLWLGVLGTSIGMIITAIATKYRDLNLMIGYFIELFIYATPVVYPLSQVPQNLMWLMHLNPVSVPIELARVCLFGKGGVSLTIVASSVAITVACLFLGLILFNKTEKNFVDVI